MSELEKGNSPASCILALISCTPSSAKLSVIFLKHKCDLILSLLKSFHSSLVPMLLKGLSYLPTHPITDLPPLQLSPCVRGSSPWTFPRNSGSPGLLFSQELFSISFPPFASYHFLATSILVLSSIFKEKVFFFVWLIYRYPQSPK